MIILDDKCGGLEAALLEYLNSEKKNGYDGSLSDYDDAVVSIKIDQDGGIVLSLDWGAAPIFFKNGGKEAIEAAYKGLKLSFSTTSYTVSLKISDIPTDPAQRTTYVANLARLKYHLFSGPFLNIANGSLKTPLEVKVRSGEFIWIIPKPDKSILAGYSHAVSDRTDLPIAQVLYHEFNDVKRDSALNACPTVQASAATEQPPADILDNFPQVNKNGIDGYFLFTAQPRHYQGPALTQRVVGQFLVFRPYLNYHFKCTKAFTHYRMMTTCQGWIQVLNRAKPDRPMAKGTRTITGKKIIEKK